MPCCVLEIEKKYNRDPDSHLQWSLGMGVMGYNISFAWVSATVTCLHEPGVDYSCRSTAVLLHDTGQTVNSSSTTDTPQSYCFVSISFVV